jgi:hypothetical protein
MDDKSRAFNLISDKPNTYPNPSFKGVWEMQLSVFCLQPEQKPRLEGHRTKQMPTQSPLSLNTAPSLCGQTSTSQPQTGQHTWDPQPQEKNAKSQTQPGDPQGLWQPLQPAMPV